MSTVVAEVFLPCVLSHAELVVGDGFVDCCGHGAFSFGFGEGVPAFVRRNDEWELDVLGHGLRKLVRRRVAAGGAPFASTDDERCSVDVSVEQSAVCGQRDGGDVAGRESVKEAESALRADCFVEEVVVRRTLGKERHESDGLDSCAASQSVSRCRSRW
jgi:hypothetical protein